MRILHCIPSMGGGGAERQLCYISEQMSLLDHEIHIAYFQEGVNTKRLNIPKDRIHRLSCINNYDPMIIYKIVKIIREIKPHIVQTWMPQLDILAGIASILTSTPFILSERNSALSYSNNWKNRLRVGIGKRANAIIANSKKGINYWTNKVTKSKLKVIRNGIPFDEIALTPKALLQLMQIDESNEIILFAGRYDKQKNLCNLLDALRHVIEEREKTIAILFGEGPQKQSLIDLKEQYKVGDRIKILDYTTEFWNWLKVANLFISVSNFEGTPNTVLEAAASKCPLVVSDIPEHREFLDDNSSYFVPGADVIAISKGIIQALSNPVEANRRSVNAYNKIKDWSTKFVAKEYIIFYNTLLGQCD